MARDFQWRWPDEPADLLDPRQRKAAALLLAAVDLPAPLSATADLWLEAARVCPGLTVGDLPLGEGRHAMLTAARALIDEMLEGAVPDCADPDRVVWSARLDGNGRRPAPPPPPPREND